MADSQSESNIFSVRIVSIDYYMAPPIPGLDISYSNFQGGKVNEVPVMRIYGSTPAGQKTCLHVHRALPYLYVPCSEISLHLQLKEEAFATDVSLALEKALKLKGTGGSKRQHIHGFNLVRARKFYGYHSLEELFVKIYFYYPHDVPRAANLLLGGAVLDKSLQPHESHIPFVLQFLIDHNLYGMGHLHLSKVKFRYPIPDIFSRNRLNQIFQHEQEIDKVTCVSAEQEEPSDDAALGLPVWISSTIPADWINQTSSALDTAAGILCYNRQSICELEADATVDDILNQQFKMYTSFSQTHSDVKMVQSLVSIWEEEYERTGVHEVPLPLDLGKPPPEEVLKTFSLGLEYEKRLTELYGRLEVIYSAPSGEDERFVQLTASSTDEGNAVELGFVNLNNTAGEPLNCSEVTDVRGCLLLCSLPCEDDGSTAIKGNDTSSKRSWLDELQVAPKAADEEALGLLRWLATSQTAGDINSDDELVCETILSPFLPAANINEVVDKATEDYECESQKECQDILDSIDDLFEFEGTKERSFHSPDNKHSSRSKLERLIPQVDGAGDDMLSTPSGDSPGNLTEIDRSEHRSSSETKGLQDIDKRFSSYKKDKSSWGSLPLSSTRHVNKDSNSVSFQGTSVFVSANEDIGDTSFLAGERVKHKDSLSKKTGTEVCESRDASLLVRCSLRDMMRRKRGYRVEQSECGSNKVKKALTDGEPKEPGSSDFAMLPVDGFGFGSPHCRPSFPDQSIGLYNDFEMKPSLGHCETFDVNTCCSNEKMGEHSVFSGLVNPAPMIANMESKYTDLIVMTLRDKPPTADLTYEASMNCSYPHTILKEPFLLEEKTSYGTAGRYADDFLPFFLREDKAVVYHTSGSHSHQEAAMGVPSLYQNDGSLLYLLTPIYSPPSAAGVNRWLDCDHRGAPGMNSVAQPEPSSHRAFSSSRICLKSTSTDDCKMSMLQSCSMNHVIPVSDPVYKENPVCLGADESSLPEDVITLMRSGLGDMEVEPCSDWLQDISQISGPYVKSKPTPLSQTGFRDPASVGGGQQLTLLSIEVQAESRGDLGPDPRVDAVYLIALGIQNDNDSDVEVLVLLYSDTDFYKRTFYGISGCKVLVFSEEKCLFMKFIRIVCSVDPDILMGWDVQGGSIGYLAERASQLGMGLLNKISRTPSEIKIMDADLEAPHKGLLGNPISESLAADSAVLEDVIIEDEWGRTHVSGVHVGGRIVLNVWRLMRSELKLNIYTLEAVAEAVLRRKVPLIHHKVLTKWFLSGSGRARYRCVEYMMERAKLNLEIINQLDMINRTSELARVFGIDFFSVLSRGSQYRVESMLLRLAHTQNYLAVSPGNQQVASQPAMECLPLVMEPESGFYADPVVVLDFQSLYPSMIIAYNLCFCTCLGKVTPSKEDTLGVVSYSPDPKILRELNDQILLTPNGVMYVPSKVRKGILPRLLEEILSTRIMVKQAMKKLAPSQQVLYRIFNSRQLALKLIANVTYGYTAAGFSGRMPCAELADSIVQCGRSTLEKAISFVNSHDKWNAKVIYGDTDSLFVLLRGRTVKDSFRIGQEIASTVTAMNPNPVTLKMEKVYHPCFLLTKKRYVGYSYESIEQIEPIFDAKGIETVRRDTCGAVAKTMEQSLRLFFEHQDILEVKAYLQRQWKRILSGRVSLQDFIFAKEVRLGAYSTRASSSLPPAAIVASKAMRADPRAEPRYAERIPYVVIHGEPGARLVDMVVDPLDLLAVDSPYRLNDLYYINKQIIPALQRVFGLVGANLNQWFSEIPRPVREAFVKHPSLALNPNRTRIDYYYLSKHCILCGEVVQASSHLCNQCLQNGPAVATAVIRRISVVESEMQHLAAVCQHCGGGDRLLENSVKCISLACSVFYERRKVQKELRGLVAVAADKGLYPKCMVEWF